MIALSEERAASRARQAYQHRERCAGLALSALGPSATMEQIRGYATERWGEEDAEDIALIALRLKTQRAPNTRHLPPDTLKGPGEMGADQEAIREATMELLRTDPGISRQDAYEVVLAKLGVQIKLSSFEAGYFYPIRRELEITSPANHGGRPRTKPNRDGKKASGKRAPPVQVPNPGVMEKLQARLLEIETEAEEIRTAIRVLERYA